ncbi:hypothetical protein CI109_100947 [Kwoniella shandongensis]|uniref:M-phase inducer phosphatase n=1 Tax=Kwoniella shandongensis TaxID=1734106 RepID=A0A5M6C5H8_9TREE|nr:uncharacterized protein CI109_001413 [Kwoniella shandongensis]KAA5530010.1 hypothetical protein CI109_001413 [Kwoniella shandongensis]
MDAFSSSPLMESFPSSRFPSPVPSPTRTDTDLPIEVDQSFNSSMSFGDTSPYFSPTPAMNKMSGISPLPIKATSSTFLSPSPAFSLKPRRPDPVPIQCNTSFSPSKKSMDMGEPVKVMGARPLGQGRAFGRELSTNVMQRSAGPATTKLNKGKMLPPALPDGKTFIRPRGGLPMQWTSSNDETGRPKMGLQAGIMRRETEPVMSLSPCSVASTSVSDEFGMDIDSPAMRSRRGASKSASPAFSGAASFSGSPGLGSFFCDSPAAPSQAAPAKRRSLITGSPASPSSGSPSAKRTSLGLGMTRPPLDKTASSSAMLFGGARANTLASRRAPQFKRPTLGPLSAGPSNDQAQRTASAISAFPILYGPPKTTLGQSGTFPRGAVAPMRRAFSVCDQNKAHETEEDESEYEASPSMAGTHAEYARRYGPRVTPRVDGSPGGKAVRASIAVSGEGAASPAGNKGKKPSPYGPGGLPGFGDNEMDGKILPCHKVKEDGLVRITPNTLDDLLAGKYTDKVKRYHIIDCRFDYEYAGGHIAGAINVKSMDALDQLLLSESAGVHANGDDLPVPSRSGELGDGEQVVLVFHCEFSAKRAPTFAKHLRSRDRLINNALYPKIFYPEVYILEGGYCGFYQTQPDRCDPKGYTPMDDPKHFERRNSDLHDFRKFSRTRSFTYGEQPSQPSRALPPCPPLAFAAASAATARRQGSTIAEEEHEHESSPSHGDTSAEMGSGTEASPCARAVSMGQPPIFGSAKSRALGRVGFSRVASYAGTGIRH